jgi:tyrosyl-tRNA synthetase
MDILTDLQYRGLSYQVTEGLEDRLEKGPLTLYNGFDPTADSLTVGNLVAVLLLRRFQLAGHTPIALVGGGTGLIGDPGGKTEERILNPLDTVEMWTEKVKKQVEPFLDFDSGSHAAQMVNNYDWLKNLTAIDLMREVGKHFPVPYMLAKDSVASRLETGISYTEFSYMILQAYDFLHLNQSHQCELQTGGSDQWGNITAGTDLIRRAASRPAFGLTCPLVTTAAGVKFGKTESGAIWLDATKTTPYQFYQFWINSEDASVVSYLKFFTFLDKTELEDLAKVTEESPEQRQAQRRLAEEVTTLVHGKEAVTKAEKISRALFYGELQDLTLDEIEQAFNDVPSHTMTTSELPLVDLLVAANISSSKRQARQDIENGAIYLNGTRTTTLDQTLRLTDGLHAKYLIIRRGKNKYYLIK